jgi:phage terminase large subunit-like protein
MANPNYDVSVSGEFLRAKIREAVQSARKQNTIKTKHLNIWCTARAAWMNMEAWKACEDPTLRDAISKASVLDRDSTWHRSSTLRDDPRLPARDRRRRTLLRLRSVLSAGRSRDRSGRQHYQEWMIEGCSRHRRQRHRLREDPRTRRRRASLRDRGNSCDPWNATKTLQDMQKEGFTASSFRKRRQRLSEPMKELEALVLAKKGDEPAPRFHHDGNPILTWMMSNVTVKPDAKDNIFPRKDRPNRRSTAPSRCVMGRRAR